MTNSIFISLHPGDLFALTARRADRGGEAGTVSKTHTDSTGRPETASTKIRVKVTPRSSRTEIAGKEDDTYRIRIASPPVAGAANQALIDFLAKRLHIGKGRILIVSGKTSRLKQVLISGLAPEEVFSLLDKASARP